MVVQKKKNSDQKAKTIKQIDELHKTYPYLLFVTSENIKSELIHELRSKIADNARILFGKKKILMKALEAKAAKGALQKMCERVCERMNEKDTLFLIFTKDLEVKEALENKSIKGYLRGGDVINEDVVLQPGILKMNEQNINVEMNTKLNACDLPCYVKDGKIVIDKEFVIARKNDKINNKQAKLLKMLCLKLAELKTKVIDSIKL